MSHPNSAQHVTPPGRLGNPSLTLGTDPRSDPRMVAAMTPFGLQNPTPPPPLDASAHRSAQLEYVAAAEQGFEAVFAALASGLPPVPGLTQTRETIKGKDGNDILLYITRPAAAPKDRPLPCVLHIHGGGMVLLHAGGPLYVRFRDELAATGVVVVGVEYRNGGGVLGPHPFPAGLEDCTSALRWVHEHRRELGVSRVTVAGESGGGNLTLATTLKTKRDGHLHMIDGVYAMVPYVSGMYGASDEERGRELPSLLENDGYFIKGDSMSILASVYDPGGANRNNPLAWPHFATVADVTGLPPHVISVNELDPLRDEGLAYYRKLHHAGVDVTGRMVLGVCHAGDIMFRAAMPDMYAATIADLHRFVTR
jgi:acetyl esterase/lipase